MMHDFPASYTPLHTFFTPDKPFYEQGMQTLSQGKVGAIVLAGGHGSRLGYNAPKGCFPVFEGKSLYQLLAEKVHAASTRYGHSLYFGIMTSDATHQKTIEHFEEAHYFGLKKEQVCFFQQQNLPLQDQNGNTLSHTAPDGNGTLFWHFAASGHMALWQARGIEHITVCTVDNALADPFQPHLIGLHTLHGNEATVVGIKREDPQEHVGVLVEQHSRLAVVEYSEMPDSQRLAFDAAGELKYPLANISYFAFSMAFINKIIKKPSTELPLHKAKKMVTIKGKETPCYKLEYFIFDLLAYCTKAEVLLLPREQFFAPLKNKTGPQSIATVQEALKNKKYNS